MYRTATDVACLHTSRSSLPSSRARCGLLFASYVCTSASTVRGAGRSESPSTGGADWSRRVSISTETFANQSALPALAEAAQTLNVLRDGLTYWLPRGAEPRCLIEQMVAAVVATDVRSGLDMSEVAGVEFWAHEGGFQAVHYDFDEYFYDRPPDGAWPTPRHSSVTFLAAGAGAPTLVLGQWQDGAADAPAVPREAALIAPRPNKHFRFNGSLAHGVLGADEDEDRTEEASRSGSARTTLLVNYWVERPHGWADGLSMLPDEFVDAFPSWAALEAADPQPGVSGVSLSEATGQFSEVTYQRYILPRQDTEDHSTGRWKADMPLAELRQGVGPCSEHCWFRFPKAPLWLGLVERAGEEL